MDRNKNIEEVAYDDLPSDVKDGEEENVDIR